MYEHVTYHQLKQILASDGNYAILLGGSWCPNTQAVIKYINEYAKKHNIDKVYFFDTKLDSGVTVAEPSNNSGTKGNANPHNNNELQIRTTNHPYAKLYVDLVRTYLTNIKTENNTAAKPSVISYVNELGDTVIGDRLQVPYLFTYNKDNKDADGTNAPILGHIELMYSWTNIQPDYVQANYQSEPDTLTLQQLWISYSLNWKLCPLDLQVLHQPQHTVRMGKSWAQVRPWNISWLEIRHIRQYQDQQLQGLRLVFIK